MRVRLHFGAVNSSCEVRINDRLVGRHENGYLAFSFDVTDYLEASGRENRLEVNVDLEGAGIQVKGISEGVLICEGRRYEIADGSVRVEPENVRTWSPEDPYLYEFTIQSGEDEVASYFALRTISVSAGKEYARLFLNLEPEQFYYDCDRLGMIVF